MAEQPKSLQITGKDGAAQIVPVLRQIGALYGRGAKSDIRLLDLIDLELVAGGRIRIQLSNVPAKSMKNLDELFEVLDRLVAQGDATEADLTISDPDPDCAFIQAVTRKGEIR